MILHILINKHAVNINLEYLLVKEEVFVVPHPVEKLLLIEFILEVLKPAQTTLRSNIHVAYFHCPIFHNHLPLCLLNKILSKIFPSGKSLSKKEIAII